MPERYIQMPWRTDRKSRRPIDTAHERIAAENWFGRLTCLLTAKTSISLFRSSPERRGFPRRAGRPFLPGSSIKGMLRSFAEALTHSCSPFPNDASHCRSRIEVCTACRLFGSQFGRQEQQSEGAYQSKVFFSDVKLENNVRPSLGEINIHTLDPHPSQGGGRIFYRHFSPSIEPRSPPLERPGDIEYLPPGSQFVFMVDFSNLEHDELSLLLYILALEQGMAHKFGFGKAKGLGSVQIAITRVQTSNQPEDVYLLLTAPRFTHDLDCPQTISEFVNERTRQLLPRLDQGQVQRLRAALALPPELRDSVSEGDTE